jgi:hypothetical protein
MTTTTTTENQTGTTTTATAGSNGSGSEGSGGRLAGATGRVRDTAAAARTRAAEAYSAARERTSSVYGSARESASRVTERTAKGIDSNPEAALIGGLALGAVIAALLPKTERETEMLGQYGRKINETAREAARAAKEAGKTQLEEAGLSRDAAKQKLSDLASQAKDAVRTSASAAAKKVKGSGNQ